MQANRKLDEATARELAVRAGVDPRTVKRAARGQYVRGMAGRRARIALDEAGFEVGSLELVAK